METPKTPQMKICVVPLWSGWKREKLWKWESGLSGMSKVSNDYSSDNNKHVTFRNESKFYAFLFKIRLAQFVPLLQNAVRPVFF